MAVSLTPPSTPGHIFLLLFIVIIYSGEARKVRVSALKYRAKPETKFVQK